MVDLASGRQRAALAIGDARANFPMAVDNDAQRIVVVFRSPPKLMAFGIGNGAVAASSDTCGDADDVFVDSKRHRLYVSCGQGVIDIFSTEGASYKRLARIPTLPGARTSLLVPELDRLFVAVRATSSDPAAVWIFRPLP